MNRSLLLVALILPLLCCSGCSMVSFGYNHADWYLRYKINEYTSFNAGQKENIHIEVDEYMRWHRKNVLPEYTAYLQKLDRLINNDRAIEPEDVMQWRADNNKLYQMTVTPMIRPAANVLSTLDPEQIAELGNYFAESNRKQKEKMLIGNEQEILSQRAERHVDLVEYLVGPLSPVQKEKIVWMSLRIPFATNHYIAQREAKQDKLISLLKSKAGADRIDALFRQWIDTPESHRSPEQQQAISAYEESMNEMTLRIVELLSVQQKKHLSRKLRSYIADFEALHASFETAGSDSE